MSSIGLANSLPSASLKHSVMWRFCAGTGVVLTLAGCVSESTYEVATSETNNVRRELNQARVEMQALEQQKEALHKLALEGETVLAGIRTELHNARESYAQHKAKLNRLSALQEKARTLHRERASYAQGIKTTKQNAEKMQAVIERYEKENGLIPGAADSLKVSQPFEVNSDSSKVVATVSPLASVPSPASLEPISSFPQSDSNPSAISPAAPSNVSPQSPNVAMLPSPSLPPSKPASAANAPPPPAGRPHQPVDDSWMASLSGWFASIWDWFFS